MDRFAAPLPIETPKRRAGRFAILSWAAIGRLLHPLLFSITFVVFGWSIALSSGLVAGACGAALGSWVAELLVRGRYRLFVIVLSGTVVAVLGGVLSELVSSSSTIAIVLSPPVAFHLADLLQWSSTAIGAVVVIRAVALRYRAALVVEGGVVVLAVARTVSAHRDGMIARPLEISDWFWTQGVDPVVAFLAVGLGAAVLLAFVLAHGRSTRRTLFQLVFVLLLGALFAIRIHGADLDKTKKNPTGAELDAKKDGDSKRRGGSEGGQPGKLEGTGSPFRDDLPRPGSGAENRPAAIVVFHKDVAPSTGIFYFRHAAFSQYNGVRLVEATRSGADADVVREFPTVKEIVRGVDADGAGRTLVATDVALLADHRRMFTLTDATEVAPTPNPEPARFRRSYHVVSSVITESYQGFLGMSAGDRSWPDDVWEHYTETPKDERYHRLAAELKANLKPDYAGDPLAQAMIVKRHLEETSTYSFRRDYEGEDDPTAAFLFSVERAGYCVHLAHAAAFLLRAMGVPARVSAGYAVPAANLGGGSALLIKNGDAHAWAEIYLGGTGWIPIEVTPERSDVKPRMFEERDLQQLLGEMARKEGRDRAAGYQGPTLMDAIRAFLDLLPKALAALLALLYLLKLWRLAAPAVVPRPGRPRVAYRAALDRLSSVGFLRSHGEPRERFARRVGAFSPSFVALTETHVGAAMGSREIVGRVESRDPTLPLAALSFRVGRELRRRVPIWRWIVGALNPVSWLWSR